MSQNASNAYIKIIEVPMEINHTANVHDTSEKKSIKKYKEM
jgi:hypothetical protein